MAVLHRITALKRRQPALWLLALLFGGFASPASAQKEAYLNYVLAAAEQGWADHPTVVANWQARIDPSVLWGYNSPSQPIYLADALGFLYEETGEDLYAERAAHLLATYGDLRDAYPADYADTRVEYENGLPALSNFFFLPPYSRSYLRIRDHASLDADLREKIERDLAGSLDFQFHFPEWGVHNRALLRAEGWYYGSIALSDHPHAGRWRQMAEVVADDNLTQWEVEDATHYQPIWLVSLISYADIAGHEALFDSPLIRYYAEYFKPLFTPAGTMVDVGDANWNPSWPRYVALFERLATEYQDPELKWMARTLFEQNGHRISVGAASEMALAYRWADESIMPQPPSGESQEVLEDIVGKKVVLRNGQEPTSTYLVHNYRDEGEGGYVSREYMRQTLTVEEEKMHHGQADENSIALLMAGGSVLLHESGYRSGLPSGPFGAYRSDYYHNRLVVRQGRRDANQPIEDFLHNSGAYRPVRTQKIDFLATEQADMARTRLLDPMGYAWDRALVYARNLDLFVVVDIFEAQETGYYTLTNLWHTRQVARQEAAFVEVFTDSIRSTVFPTDYRLRIQMLNPALSEIGVYEQDRHFQNEKAVYQTKSRHFRAGNQEVLVTALIPHPANNPPDPGELTIQLLHNTDMATHVGVHVSSPGTETTICLKTDLESELVDGAIRPLYTWEKGRYACGEFVTDAHFLFAEVSPDTVDYTASQFLKVLFGGEPLIEALPNTHGLQPDGSPPRIGYTKWRRWAGQHARR